MAFVESRGSSPSYVVPLLLIVFAVTLCISILIATRILTVLLRPKPTSLSLTRPPASDVHPTHLLVVLGSGGHTAEMLNMLSRLPHLCAKFTHRTYVVSSGDGFSALKAREFEMGIQGRQDGFLETAVKGREPRPLGDRYDIVTVRRARRVHQSLLSTPWSASLCLWDCIRVLTGGHPEQLRPPQQPIDVRKPRYPDLIITNGPGTGVCVVLASLILLFLGFGGPISLSSNPQAEKSPSKPSQWQHSEQMRTIFVESWARVKTLSLSGKILLPLVDRFLVQWPELEGRGGGKAEFVGALIG